MSDLLLRSSRSLIHQSYRARERAEPLNGDGFGVGWYARDIDPIPGLFTSVQPAWGNRNLTRLAPKIFSTCFFAHVRAASRGSAITELNCHPFQFQRLLWMHNGRIAGFSRIKRRLQALLDDEFYDSVLGTTDTEHAFALFLQRLLGSGRDYSLSSMEEALTATIHDLEELTAAVGVEESSYYNFAVTDGEALLATRYVTARGHEPETLYVSRGSRLELENEQFRMIEADTTAVEAVIIASEPITDVRENWQAIPRNHCVSVSPQFEVRVRPI
jgi:predicted glutamine amidotransferase